MAILIICIIAFTAGIFCGYGLGRNGSTRGTGRCNNSPAESGLNDCKSTAERAESAVESAVKANEEAAATIQRMRDIVNRHNHDSDNTVCEGETE
jgi:hypothetical protein